MGRHAFPRSSFSISSDSFMDSVFRRINGIDSMEECRTWTILAAFQLCLQRKNAAVELQAELSIIGRSCRRQLKL